MRIIIAAAGKGTRFKHPEIKDKCLCPIFGVPFIQDTINKFKPFGGIHVIGNDNVLGLENFHTTGIVGCEAYKFLSSIELWTDNTLILFGDTFFSDSAVKLIVNEKVNDYHFFGRHGANPYTNCDWGEIFAMAIRNKYIINSTLNTIIRKENDGKIERSNAWALWNELGANKQHFTEIMDFTEDFDYAKDYTDWVDRYSKYYGIK